MENGKSDCVDNFLLDDLMDQGLISVDINLGTEDLQGLQSTSLLDLKASPSHESDSGFSNMSSPCHSIISIDDSSDGRENDTQIFPNLLDMDMIDYLGDDYLNEDISDIHEESRGKFCKSISTESTSDDENIAPVPDNVQPPPAVLPLKTMESSVPVVHKSVRNVKKSLSINNELNNNEVKKVPAVKVIKVVKTPSSSSKKETEMQIFEAIEDRNRKNAVQAKLNREKKKAYIKSLEDEISELKSQNHELMKGQERLQKSKSALEDEVLYLKSVLANQSSLSCLLKNIPDVKNIKLSSTFAQRKRCAELDHDYEITNKRSKKTAGVCLHVDSDNVTLEFCAECSSMSQNSDEES